MKKEIQKKSTSIKTKNSEIRNKEIYKGIIYIRNRTKIDLDDSPFTLSLKNNKMIPDCYVYGKDALSFLCIKIKEHKSDRKSVV